MEKYKFYIKDFLKIQKTPIAYWISKKCVDAFSNITIDKISSPKKGVDTGENDIFLRHWFEPNVRRISFGCSSIDDFRKTCNKYVPITKGGPFRKWYGNNDYIIDWENDGFRAKNNGKSNIRNTQYFFKEHLTWTDFTSSDPSFRYDKKGFIHDVAGPCLFDGHENMFYIFALLNSKVAIVLLEIIASTVHYNVGDIGNVPVILNEDIKELVDIFVKDNINNSKKDWDSFETSWYFKKHPLI